MGYKKTKYSREEIHETHRKIQFIRQQNKWRYFKEFKADIVEKRSAHSKQKWLNHVQWKEKTLDAQKNSLTIDLSEDEHLDGH
jgi:hypothetical protein